MTNELTKYEPNMSLKDMRTLAGDFAKSGYFQDAKDMVQVVVKIQAGIEMGFGPVYSMTKIYIVQGKVMVSAEALGALVKRSGRYDYLVKSLTNTECVLEFTDNGKPVYTSKFTMEDAKQAELIKPGSGWSKWPRAMLMSKALSQGARIVCPHVIAGAYTPEDFGVDTDADGNPKQVITIETPKAPAASQDAQGQASDVKQDNLFDKDGNPVPTKLTDEQKAKIKEMAGNGLPVRKFIDDAGWKNIKTWGDLTTEQAERIIKEVK